MLWQQPWVWVAGGVVLAALEMLAPGFYLLGLAAGALLVGVLIWVGVMGASLPVMVLVMAVTAVPVWLIARRLVGVRAGQVKRWDRDINEN
jgi:membrane protein implicated in regulation of membrane protease activity